MHKPTAIIKFVNDLSDQFNALGGHAGFLGLISNGEASPGRAELLEARDAVRRAINLIVGHIELPPDAPVEK